MNVQTNLLQTSLKKIRIFERSKIYKYLMISMNRKSIAKNSEKLQATLQLCQVLEGLNEHKKAKRKERRR